MKELTDKELELVLAGQIIFAHKAVSKGAMHIEEAAYLLGMDVEHLTGLFDKLGLGQPDSVMTFEEMLDESVPREMYFTAEEIRSIFLPGQEDDKGKRGKQ